jgi:hypothetical protein
MKPADREVSGIDLENEAARENIKKGKCKLALSNMGIAAVLSGRAATRKMSVPMKKRLVSLDKARMKIRGQFASKCLKGK